MQQTALLKMMDQKRPVFYVVFTIIFCLYILQKLKRVEKYTLNLKNMFLNQENITIFSQKTKICLTD